MRVTQVRSERSSDRTSETLGEALPHRSRRPDTLWDSGHYASPPEATHGKRVRALLMVADPREVKRAVRWSSCENLLSAVSSRRPQAPSRPTANRFGAAEALLLLAAIQASIAARSARPAASELQQTAPRRDPVSCPRRRRAGALCKPGTPKQGSVGWPTDAPDRGVGFHQQRKCRCRRPGQLWA